VMMTRRQRGQKGFFAHSELALELRLFVCRYDEERREPTEKKKKRKRAEKCPTNKSSTETKCMEGHLNRSGH